MQINFPYISNNKGVHYSKLKETQVCDMFLKLEAPSIFFPCISQVIKYPPVKKFVDDDRVQLHLHRILHCMYFSILILFYSPCSFFTGPGNRTNKHVLNNIIIIRHYILLDLLFFFLLLLAIVLNL